MLSGFGGRRRGVCGLIFVAGIAAKMELRFDSEYI